MPRNILFFIALILCLCGANAHAERPSWVPVWENGKFVYTLSPPKNLPSRFTTGNGLKEIQATATKLRHFYIFITDQPPVTSTTDDAGARASLLSINEAWNNEDPNRLQNACLFLVSFNPRRYRVVCGTNWQNQYGLKDTGLKPYEAKFLEKARGSTPDFPAGIIAFMEAVADTTDPERVRLRVANENLVAAFNSLTETLNRAGTSAPHTKDYYSEKLDRARVALARRDAEVMNKTANDMRQIEQEVIQQVNAHERKIEIALAIAFVLFFVGLGYATLRLTRRRRLASLREEFEDTVGGWKASIDLAISRYAGFKTSNEKLWAELERMTGETGQCAQEIKAALTKNHDHARALEKFIEKCRHRIQHTTDIKQLEALIRSLEEPFIITTTEENTPAGLEERHITINPHSVIQNLSETEFARITMKWRNLLAAIEAVKKPAEQAFPNTTFGALAAKALEHRLPRNYLKAHPLFEGDEAFYTSLNALRHSDPLGYTKQLDDCRRAEKEVVTIIDRICRIIASVNHARVDEPTQATQIIIRPAYDPNAAWNTAEHLCQSFFTELAEGSSPARLENLANQVIAAYQEVSRRMNVIAAATTNLAAAKLNIDKQKQLITTTRSKAVARSNKAKHVHVFTSDKLDTSNHALAQANRIEQIAEAAERDRDLFAAIETLGDAQSYLTTAHQELLHLLDHCQQLDDQKVAYESRLANHHTRKRRAEEEIRTYGSTPPVFATFCPPTHLGPHDYCALHTPLDAVEHAWQEPVDAARDLYMAEQERLRRIREEEKRLVREEQERIARLIREQEEREAQARREAERQARLERERIQREIDVATEERRRAERRAADEERSRQSSYSTSSSYNDSGSSFSSSSGDSGGGFSSSSGDSGGSF